MIMDGIPYQEAACMSASWAITELFLGADDNTLERSGVDVQVHEILEEAFGCAVGS